MNPSGVMQCPHCANQTIIHSRANCQDIQPPAAQPGQRQILTVWTILQCPVCLKPIVVEQRWERTASPNPNMVTAETPTDERLLYPLPKGPFANLPEPVARAYSRALKVRNVEPNSCAMLLGRTLEAMCNQEGVTKGVLAHRLKKLADDGRIPPLLAEMAQSAKEFRNLGSHEDDEGDEVSEDDVPTMFELVDAILEYMYVAPAKVNAVKARLVGGGTPTR